MLSSKDLQAGTMNSVISYLIPQQPQRFSVSAASEDAVRQRRDHSEAAQHLEQRGRRRAVAEAGQRHAEEAPAAPQQPQAAARRCVAAGRRQKDISHGP